MYKVINNKKNKIYRETFNTFMSAFKFQQRMDRKAHIEYKNSNNKIEVVWDPYWEYIKYKITEC